MPFARSPSASRRARDSRADIPTIPLRQNSASSPRGTPRAALAPASDVRSPQRGTFTGAGPEPARGAQATQAAAGTRAPPRAGVRARAQPPLARRRQAPTGTGDQCKPRAPIARALTMSLPRRNPLSTSTGNRPATAWMISGSASIVEPPPSSVRPPWFDTMIASTPFSTANRASSAARIPLSRALN